MSESPKAINESENAKLFRTRMDIFVLNALDEKDGQGYGYDVISYIQEHTKGHYKIKSISTIYNILKRLEAAGYVSSEKGGGESYGAARVYYTLTPAGKEYLERDKKEWKYIRTLLNNLVSDEDFDLDNEEPPYSASVLKPLTKRSREGSAEDFPADPSLIPPAENVDISDDSLPSDVYQEEKPSFASYDTEDDVSAEIASDQAPSYESEPVKEDVIPGFTAYTERYAPAPETATAEPEVFRPVLNNTSAPVQTIAEQEKNAYDYSLGVKEQPVVPQGATSFDTELDKPLLSPYLEKLKTSLQSEGYILSSFRPSQKANTIRYFFVNKIVRDTAIASFLYLVVTLLVTNLFKNIFGISLTTMHVLAAIGFVAALACVIVYAREPKKKKKDATNLKLLNSALLMIFVVLYMAVIVYYLFTSKYNFTSSQMYAPAIILSTIPFAGFMFSVLYKSERYFQS